MNLAQPDVPLAKELSGRGWQPAHDDYPEIVRAVLALRDAGSQAAFDALYLELLRATNSVAAHGPKRPHPSQGTRSRLLYPLRKLLWRLLQPALEEQVWRQNAVNRALTLTLEFQREAAVTKVANQPGASTLEASVLPLGGDTRPIPRRRNHVNLKGDQTRRVEQWLAGFSPGDAVSQDALAIQAALVRKGMECELLAPADSIDPSGQGLCRSFDPGAASGVDESVVRLYHYSIGSPLTAAFTRAPGRRILRYHNITPAEFFDPFDDRLASRLRNGRIELRAAVAAADEVWAVSKFNAAEIESLSGNPVAVVPLFFSPQRLELAPDTATIQRLEGDGFFNILFVGRVAPNKRLEDLMLAFDLYRRTINARSRLLIVGSTRSCPRYYAMLWMLAAVLDNPAICFEDYATDRVLNAYYRTADLFVCPSAHEGYGAPLIEAMAHGVAVLARRSGGSPEALDGAGILYDDPAPPALARWMQAIGRDDRLRSRILEGQRERIARWRQRNPEAELEAILCAGAE